MWWWFNHQELVVFSSCKFLILLRLRPCWSENKNVFETFQNLLCKCYYNNYCLMLLPSCFLLFIFALKFGLEGTVSEASTYIMVMSWKRKTNSSHYALICSCGYSRAMYIWVKKILDGLASQIVQCQYA